MNYLVPTILSLICASSSADAQEPVARMMDDRRSTHPVYAKTFSDEYEPFAVAAIPLNAAMPIFHLISPGYRTKYKKPVKTRTLHNQYRDTYAYDAPNSDQIYEPYGYDTEEVEIVSPQKYSKTSSYEDESSAVVVYARPNKHGGYSYRKNPSHSSHSSHSSYSPYSSYSSPVPTFSSTDTHDQKPVIIRIHKYRVIH